MTKYFYIHPEVAGGFGPDTILDRSTHPPRVDKLHYEFESWPDDAILTSFPCLIATEQATIAPKVAGVTGIESAPVKITTTEEFQEHYVDRELPHFLWLRVIGSSGKDDFGMHLDTRGERPRNRFVLSERALDILRSFGLNHAEIEPFKLNQI